MRKSAIVMSGGLSHFVIDEAFDEDVSAAMKGGDERASASIPSHYFRSGTSETKNWITGARRAHHTELEDERLIDYVPCYRSEAGTGNAMAFASMAVNQREQETNPMNRRDTSSPPRAPREEPLVAFRACRRARRDA